MYRPEGMKENPYTNHGAVLKEMGNEIAWESGADAMLEGLKAEGIEFRKWMGQDTHHLAERIQQTYNTREGWLVFIEED